MKPIAEKSRTKRAAFSAIVAKKAGFTIIELLTVMSIIVILIGLLVPALNKVKRFAMDVRQKAQFHSIEAALELFNSQYEAYPPSSAKDESPPPDAWNDRADYCGANKLSEAMMGQDLMGFHPDSLWRSDGTLYYAGSATKKYLYDKTTLPERKGALLPLENANAYKLGDLYKDTQPFNPDLFVLCDVYNRVTNRSTGKKVGMPILYYKAETSKGSHNVTKPNDPDNIYNYLDNYELVALGFPGQQRPPGGPDHELNGLPANPGQRFYMNTQNDKVNIDRPFKEDTFILISAGWDGEYGTADDICNFEWKYKQP